METHEWRERTDDGLRYYRASYHAGRWSFATTLKSDPDWERIETEQVPEEMWRALRDVLWRKYQRKRLPWERIAAIDKLLGDEPAES